jgi:hypothetical protein
MSKLGRPKKYTDNEYMMFRIEGEDKKIIQRFCEVHQLTITRFYEKAAARLLSRPEWDKPQGGSKNG